MKGSIPSLLVLPRLYEGIHECLIKLLIIGDSLLQDQGQVREIIGVYYQIGTHSKGPHKIHGLEFPAEQNQEDLSP